MNLVRRSSIVAGFATAATVLGLAVAPTAGAGVAPRVTAVSPASGFTAGGNRVTVSGSGFSQVTAVYFGTAKGSAIKVLSTGKLTVTAPAHVDGRVDVRVKTSTAESAIVLADHYTYKPTPVTAVAVLGVTSISVALGWSNPKDPYLNQIVVRRSAAGSSTPPTLATGVAVATLAKTATATVASGLAAGSTYAFSVFARDTNGHYATAATKVAHTITWNSPDLTDPSQGFPAAVTCTSTSFCALVDQLGTALSFLGNGWQTPQKLTLDHSLTAVSCTAPTFCVAVGTEGFAAAFDGTGSTTPTTFNTGDANNLTGVSCLSDTFCIAVDSIGQALTYHGAGMWTTATIDPFGLTGISCVSGPFCVAVDPGGDAVTFNGSSWTFTPVVPGSFSSVSCVSSTLCVAMGEGGATSVYNGSTWGQRPTSTLQSAAVVSCSSTTFCLASDIFGNTEVYNSVAGTWGDAHTMCDSCDLDITGVSCPSDSLCMAVDGNAGRYSILSLADEWTDPVAGDITTLPQGVSCPTATFCALTDTAGRARLSNGSAWGSGTPVFTTLGPVSCPTATFCLAAAGVDVAAYHDGMWSGLANLEPSNGSTTINDISCSSPSFCAVVDSKGRVAFYNGTQWSALGTIDFDALTTVSCSGPKLCVAADTSGRLLNFNGLTWSSPTYADTYNRVTDVSCVGANFCAAVDDAGNALYFNGSSWSALSIISGGGGALSLSCVSARFCYATTTASTVSGFGPGLTAIESTLPSHGFPTQISCNAAPMCVVADSTGETIKGA